MNAFNDPFCVSAMTLFSQLDLLRQVHPALSVDVFLNDLIGNDHFRDFAGIVSVVFTARLSPKGRTKVLSCYHRRVPKILWQRIHGYCDVESFMNQHLLEEMATWIRLVRAGVPGCCDLDRTHATSLYSLVCEGHFSNTKELFERTYDFDGVDIKVVYKDHLVGWINAPEHTMWFIARLFDCPHETHLSKVGTNQPSFTAEEVAYFKTYKPSLGSDKKTGFLPSFVQPYLGKREAEVRDLVVLGLEQKEIGKLLGMKFNTVKKNLQQVFDAYGVTKQSAVLVEFLRRGGTTEILLHLARKYMLLPATGSDTLLKAVDELHRLG